MMTIFFPTLRQYEIAQVIDTTRINDFENKKNKYTDYIELKLLSRRIYYKLIYSKIFT
jgi:hypothetical protein